MILTYKVKHNKDFSKELSIAKKIANFAIQNRDKLSTKYVAHLGLKSVIANQILRKYGRNWKAKTIKSVNLIVPHQGIKCENNIIKISSLRLNIPFDKNFEKINQIELNNKYAFISITIKENETIKTDKHIGVDLNTTGHCAVMAVKETGKVYKLGKKANHIHKKYKHIRKSLQKKGLYRVVKRIKNKEQRIIKDLNHKISRFIVNKAVKEKAEIRLEDLKGIRQTTKSRRSFKYALNSWSYYQLGQFIRYKASLAGIPVSFIEPAYTSKCCSICGQKGERNGKSFKCPQCGHVENADSNAAFNISLPSLSILQLQADRDVCKSRSGEAQVATQLSPATTEPRCL
jgi:putative transposase